MAQWLHSFKVLRVLWVQIPRFVSSERILSAWCKAALCVQWSSGGCSGDELEDSHDALSLKPCDIPVTQRHSISFSITVCLFPLSSVRTPVQLLLQFPDAVIARQSSPRVKEGIWNSPAYVHICSLLSSLNLWLSLFLSLYFSHALHAHTTHVQD